jgi:hypothetical protein
MPINKYQVRSTKYEKESIVGMHRLADGRKPASKGQNPRADPRRLASTELLKILTTIIKKTQTERANC